MAEKWTQWDGNWVDQEEVEAAGTAEALELKKGSPLPSKIFPKTAARGILGKLGGPIADIVTSQQAGEIPGEPPGLPSIQDPRYPSDLQRDMFTATIMAEVPKGFSPLTVPEGWEESLRLKLGRSDWGAAKKPGEGVMPAPLGPLMGEPPEWKEEEFEEIPGSYKNPSILLQPKKGVNLPPLRIGRQTAADFINFIKGILSEEEINQAGQWYRTGKMVEPFRKAVGPEKTPEMQAGAMLASQQKAPGPALGAYLRQLEQVKRGVPYAERRKSGQQDQPLVELASGQPITRGAAQKIYDFFDSGEQKKTRTFYGNDERAGSPFVVDTISFRNMGALDRAYWEWIQKNYKVPEKGKLYLDSGGIVVDTPKGKVYAGATWDEAMKDESFTKALEVWEKEKAGKKIPKKLEGYKLPAAPEQIRKGWGTKVGFAQYEFLGDEGRRLTRELNAMGFGEDHGLGSLEASDVQAIGWMALGKVMPSTSGTDFSDAIRTNMQQVAAALESGWMKENHPEYFDLTPSEQFSVTRQGTGWWADQASDLVGTMSTIRIHGSGAWMTYPPEPTLVDNLLASPEGADAVAMIYQWGMRQQSVWAYRPVKAGNAVTIDILETSGDNITKQDNLQQVWTAVNQVDPDLFRGYSPVILDGRKGIRLIIPAPATAKEAGDKELLKWYADKLKVKETAKGVPEALKTHLEGLQDDLEAALDSVFPDGDFDLQGTELDLRIQQQDWENDNGGEATLERLAGLIGRERVDTLRATLWPEFEAFISNAIQQAQLRSGREEATGLKGAPDWRIIKRALEEEDRPQVEPFLFPEIPLDLEALKTYEGARQTIPPILNEKNRKRNFDRWWTWDFEKDKPGKEPSVLTERFNLENFIGPHVVNKPEPTDEPLKVYHGSPSFQGTAFDPDTAQTRDHGYYGKGFYFTPDATGAMQYAESTGAGLAPEMRTGPVIRVIDNDGNLLEEIDYGHLVDANQSSDPAALEELEDTESELIKYLTGKGVDDPQDFTQLPDDHPLIQKFVAAKKVFYRGLEEEKYPKTKEGLVQYAEDEFDVFVDDDNPNDEVSLKLVEDTFSPEVLPFYLSIKKPFNYNDLTDEDQERLMNVGIQMPYDASRREVEQRLRNKAEGEDMDPSELLQKAGYDSIIVGDEIIVFDPKQIKSATGNIGLFNPRSDDFLTQLERPIKERNQQIAQLQGRQIARRRAA